MWYYLLSGKGCSLDMAFSLQSKGISATYYHAALDPFKKQENVQARPKCRNVGS